jgi:purine-cytosine permease-like protein
MFGRRGVTLPVDANTGQIIGWVIVEFATNDEAWKALEMVAS